MQRDRTNELRVRLRGYSYERSRSSSESVSYEMSPRGGSRGGGSFLDAVNGIKQSIERVRSNVQELKALHQRALVEVQSHNAQQIQRQISQLTDATSDLIQQTHKEVKAMSGLSGDARVKDTQQKALAKKLMDTAKEFQNVQQKARSNMKNQMERQYRIARPNASEDEVRQAVSNPQGRVFQQSILTAGLGEQRRALEEVQQRNNDILKMEKSINELFQLFQDMEMLLENQQTMIDNIDQHVDNTVSHLESGSKQLTSAVEHAKSARRKKWCLFITVIVLLAVAAFLVWFFYFRTAGDNKDNKQQQPQQKQA